MAKQLGAMYEEVKKLKSSSFRETDLNHLNIKILPLDLDQPARSGPLFFRPLREDRLSGEEEDNGPLVKEDYGSQSSAYSVGISLHSVGLIGSTERKICSILNPHPYPSS
ncbi:predicted protein [Uncinocarpus reesii 1704]|uniref:Uncharacterized protein n=1 Tax=Uncinocarpus reesii (strain UAMH 1704) TaxID=336963 RepID=C4JG82_UNCRE|nr:uncharacterized protein UREG_02480 [Uncinocarpus reesii 1704]EEP77631.1 predicted protein [Uncinocarpus reesii 1704]